MAVKVLYGRDAGEHRERLYREARVLEKLSHPGIVRYVAHGETPEHWRAIAFSEYDYSMLPAAAKLGLAPRDARLFMAADRRWKYVHAVGFRPMLFDMQDDPEEFVDRGADPAYATERGRLAAVLSEWALRQSQRTTISERQILGARGKSQRRGILIGVWDESDIPQDLWSVYRGGE